MSPNVAPILTRLHEVQAVTGHVVAQHLHAAQSPPGFAAGFVQHEIVVSCQGGSVNVSVNAPPILYGMCEVQAVTGHAKAQHLHAAHAPPVCGAQCLVGYHQSHQFRYQVRASQQLCLPSSPGCGRCRLALDMPKPSSCMLHMHRLSVQLDVRLDTR